MNGKAGETENERVARNEENQYSNYPNGCLHQGAPLTWVSLSATATSRSRRIRARPCCFSCSSSVPSYRIFSSSSLRISSIFSPRFDVAYNKSLCKHRIIPISSMRFALCSNQPRGLFRQCFTYEHNPIYSQF